MSFKFSAAHSSRIKKPTKPPAFKRNSSSTSPYSSLPRRKPLQRTSTKPEKADDEEVGPNSLGAIIPLIAMSRNFWIISSRMFQERLHNATREMNTSLLWRTNIHTSTDTTP
jgi:hypothetical protein